jgi:transposase
MTEQDRTRWTKLVADFETSDLTQREFATERGISFSNLRNWIYKLRKESRPLVAKPPRVSGQGPEQAPAPEGSRLVPVRVVASAVRRQLFLPVALPRVIRYWRHPRCLTCFATARKE